MKLLAGQTIGIDLGTTYSAVARLNDSGVPVSLKNADGDPTTASVILLGEGGQIVIGPSRERLVQEPPERVVIAVKREMGNRDFARIYMNKRLTPEFLSALILKKLKQDAESQIGAITNAVITVPYYFNDHCRKSTQDAGQIAGLNVIDILNEPTAATLAYAWLRGELGRLDAVDATEKTIMVYDLGGGTFDVTVVKYTPTNFRVVATDGDVRLGGLDWTGRLADRAAETFEQRFGVNLRKDAAAWLQLNDRCEAAKRALSTTSQVTLEIAAQGRTLTTSVTRNEFERMTGDLLQRTQDTTELVLQAAGVTAGELDEVLLVGGSTHMPAVERMLRETTGRTPSRQLDPDTAVAQGAAIHAAILEAKMSGAGGRLAQAVIKRLRSVSTHDVNSHSLGIEITDPQSGHKRNHIMIPRNTPIPRKMIQRFVTTVANPESILLRIVEGEASDIEACTRIGDFRIVGLPPNLPLGSPVELTYSYNANGRIHAMAKELTGNAIATVQIDRDMGLNDAGLAAFQTLARDYHVE